MNVIEETDSGWRMVEVDAVVYLDGDGQLVDRNAYIDERDGSDADDGEVIIVEDFERYGIR